MGWFDYPYGNGDSMDKTPTARKAAANPAQTYDEWYDEQIRLGLEDIEAGRVVSHEEVVRRGDAQLRRLEKKHAKAA